MKALQHLLKIHQAAVAFITGILLVVGGYTMYDSFVKPDSTSFDSDHVHADFLAYINDERLDLTADTYQSSPKQILHADYHFHDNKDTLIHRHAADLTLVAFMSSLGFTLSDTCLVTDTAESFCTDAMNALQLYVNNELVKDVTAYVPEDEDRILLYYGIPNNPKLTTYL